MRAVLLISTGPIADSFLPLLSEKALVERYRLITFRQRRLASSTNGAAPVSFAEHAADAAALLGHLDVRRTHVAGHSTGAAIALQLAVDRPDIVQTLALFEPPLVGAPSAGAFFEKAGPALAAYGSGDRDGAMAGFLSVVCSLDWETCRKVIEKHVPGGVAQAMTNENVDNFFASYLPALTAWQFGADQAASISRPVLSVLGMETDQLFVDSHELLHSWFPQVEDCRIEGVAHLLHMQRPEPVARGVAEFFARHPMTGGDIHDGRSTLAFSSNVAMSLKMSLTASVFLARRVGESPRSSWTKSSYPQRLCLLSSDLTFARWNRILRRRRRIETFRNVARPTQT